MRQKEIETYLKEASRVSLMSPAKKMQVGAVIAKPGGLHYSDGLYPILSSGYNSMPHGLDTCCEVGGKTRPEVLHAEAVAILNCAKAGHSTKGAWLFVTHSPCLECAKLISQCGITSVIYLTEYKKDAGIVLLKQLNINVWKYGN